MAAPDLVSPSMIVPMTSMITCPFGNLGVGVTPVVSCVPEMGFNVAYKINLLMVSNINGMNLTTGTGTPSTPIDISAAIKRDGDYYFIAGVVSVPPDGTLILIGRENPLYLMENDLLYVVSDIASTAQAICSYEILKQ